jgi:hypothetical protein
MEKICADSCDSYPNRYTSVQKSNNAERVSGLGFSWKPRRPGVCQMCFGVVGLAVCTTPQEKARWHLNSNRSLTRMRSQNFSA